MKSGRNLLWSIFLVADMILVATSIRAYPTGPEPGVTGGFGEPTCVRCHNTYELNAGKAEGLGDLVISGLPKKYESGKTYPVKVEITHVKDRMAWGFQLAARMKATGAQAGEFQAMDDNTQVLSEKGIQYIEHKLEGTFSNIFEFRWVAPSSPAGDIMVHAAGNAANGDSFPGGDYIYSTSVTISPAPE